jgi:eukaryotic-like serine/threonine-protein kinase
VADLGRMIGGRYKLLELLGEGIFATVYRATDVQASREVAVKILRPEYASDPDFMSDFRWQSRVAANLEHQNIARVLDFGTDRGSTFLVTEYVDGADLATLLERNGPVPPRRAARAAAEAARALQAAHDRGLPHGDLQPGNVMVTRDGHIKVTDFGVARAAAAVSDVTTANIKGQVAPAPGTIGRGAGTKIVAPPSEAADIEALGYLLYEMLTGRAPWVGETPQAVLASRKAGPPPRPSTLVPAVPETLDEITLRALSPVNDWRYSSAAMVADALDAFVDGGEVVAGAAVAPAGAAAAAAAGASVVAASGAAADVATSTGAAPAAIASTTPSAPVRLGRGFYADDAYASGPGRVTTFDSEEDDDMADRHSLEQGRARRQARRSGELDPLDEPTGTSPWAWVAGMLGILIIAVIGLIVVLLVSNKPAPETFTMPSLVNMTYNDAQAQAQQYGFTIMPTFQANTGNQTPNTIVAQDRQAGSQVDKGATVTVTVVTGQGTVIVPDLTGKSENDARSALTSAGLQAGDRTEQFDPSIPPGQIISSNPRAGIAVQYGSTVDYVVSKGPEPTPSPTPAPTASPTAVPTPVPTPIPTPAPTPSV